MKRFPFLLALLAILAIGMTSCKKGAELYDVTITAYYPAGYDSEKAASLPVTIRHNISGTEVTVTTDATGVAVVALEEGVYKIQATQETSEFYFNGITENLAVSATGANNWEIHLEASSKKGGLVFKEIYYTGSKTEAGGSYFSDQFHEIYNNSDEVIYLDGVCLGLLEPQGSTPTVWVNEDGSIMDRLPLTFHVLMFPGNGQTYPLEPRTSVVVAQDAIDHQTDPLGNPLSPVNMGKAPFETFIEAPGKDTDNPESANMIVMYSTSATMVDWLHSVSGAAVVMFRLPTGLDHESFVNDPSNFMQKPGTTSATLFFMIDKEWVIDGVECNRPEEDKRFKRLPTSVDAGMVWCSASYNSKSVRRKVEKILDGKVYYQDTNNSSNDFLGEQDPTPFIHPTTVD